MKETEKFFLFCINEDKAEVFSLRLREITAGQFHLDRIHSSMGSPEYCWVVEQYSSKLDHFHK